MNPEKDDLRQFCVWDIPVYLRIGHGLRETIDGPSEALLYLETRWPAERGKSYQLAKTACTEAVERYGSLDLARETFTAAAVEVRILA